MTSFFRFGHRWSDQELRLILRQLEGVSVSFKDHEEGLNEERGWRFDARHAVLGREHPGPPLRGGLFQRAKEGLVNYTFSDPCIVQGHFDPGTPLLGRNMLLEIKCLGLHFLCGVRITRVRSECDGTESIFGFRYDTLKGHIERGSEWFLLQKCHETGLIRFRIEATWRAGAFPNWWTRYGFLLVGRFYRNAWQRRAPQRLRQLASGDHPQARPKRDIDPHDRH